MRISPIWVMCIALLSGSVAKVGIILTAAITENRHMQLNLILLKANKLGIILAVMGALILAGCGGGGGGGGGTAANTTPTPATKTGVVYPVISGLQYQTNSTSGVVSSNGSYSYAPNEAVTFSVGGVVLGTTPAAAQVTPLNLANDVSSTNLLRILLALDTDNNLSNGITLISITAPITNITLNLTLESSVVAALASLSPTAVLPAASTAQVTTALASAKTTASSNLGTYGSKYSAIQTSWCTNPTDPKNAVVDFTSQPDWATGAMTGTATLTLNDNTTVSVPFTTRSTQYVAGTTNYTLFLNPSYKAKSRIVFLEVSSTLLATTSPEGVCRQALRDTSPTNPNIPPVVNVSNDQVANSNECSVTTPATFTGSLAQYNYALASTAIVTCSMTNINLSGSAITEMYGAALDNGHTLGVSDVDVDGFDVAWAWKSSKGTTGTGRTFSETCTTDSTGATNENVTVTLTVTDDEGATGTKTWNACKAIGTGPSLGATSATSGGATLTLSAPFTSLSGLIYTTSQIGTVNLGTVTITTSDFFWEANSLSTSGATLFQSATLGYSVVGSASPYEYLSFNMAPILGGDVIYLFGDPAGIFSSSQLCLVSVSVDSSNYPLCSSMGIAISKSAGTITFTSTPVFSLSSTGTITGKTGTLNGSLSFPPF